jgi:4-diphosphocytidyl-2-C-methyl-D-erythritol kinase
VSATARVTLHAPAKVNLHLAVGGRRPDGYHDVVTVLQALDLADTVVVSRSKGDPRVICQPSVGVEPRDNLASSALRAVSDRLGIRPAYDVEITKRIPAGAGLGGGSSDAAAVIAGVALLEGASADDPLLVNAAALVGADVPFFLVGGTALLTGRGDVVARRLPTPCLDLVLVRPAVSLPTAAAYAAFDRLLSPPPRSADDLIALLTEDPPPAAEEVAGLLYNNMSEASAGLVPEVGEALAWLRGRAEVLGECMAGSGSTVFGVCADREQAEAVAEDARGKGWWSAAATTVGNGVTASEGT